MRGQLVNSQRRDVICSALLLFLCEVIYYGLQFRCRIAWKCCLHFSQQRDRCGVQSKIEKLRRVFAANINVILLHPKIWASAVFQYLEGVIFQ